MTTAAPVKNQNRTKAARQARWLRLCRFPLLFAFALVAYEAARLPLVARSTDPPSDLLADAALQAEVDANADASPDQVPVPLADDLAADAEQGDFMAEVLMQDESGGDSAEPFPADWLETKDEAEPAGGADQDVWATQIATAVNKSNRLVGDLIGMLAEGATVPAADTQLFGPQADHPLREADTDVPHSSAVTTVIPEAIPALEGTPRETTQVEPTHVGAGPAAGGEQPLVLLNLSEYELGYLVDGEVHRLGPGERHELGSAQSRAIEFHRGGDFGDISYKLSAGTYEFRVGNSGWELLQ